MCSNTRKSAHCACLSQVAGVSFTHGSLGAVLRIHNLRQEKFYTGIQIFKIVLNVCKFISKNPHDKEQSWR